MFSRDRFGYFEYAPSNVPFDDRGAQYFRDVFTDESIRRSFTSRFSNLINSSADATKSSEAGQNESASATAKDEPQNQDEDQKKSSREESEGASRGPSTTSTSELRALEVCTKEGLLVSEASAAHSERVSSDQQPTLTSAPQLESKEAPSNEATSIADRLLEKLANSEMSAEEPTGLRLSLRIPGGSGAPAGPSAGHSGRGGRNSLFNKLTAKKMLSARDISRISAAENATRAAASASASAIDQQTTSAVSPSATSPSGYGARKQRKIAPKRIPGPSDSSPNVYQRQLSKTIESCQSNLLNSPSKRPLVTRLRDPSGSATASASADASDSTVPKSNSSNGAPPPQSTAAAALTAMPPRKRHLLLSSAATAGTVISDGSGAAEPASHSSSALDATASATSDQSAAPTSTTLIDASGIGAPSPKRAARSFGDNSPFAFSSAQAAPAIPPNNGLSDGIQNHMKSLVSHYSLRQ